MVVGRIWRVYLGLLEFEDVGLSNLRFTEIVSSLGFNGSYYYTPCSEVEGVFCAAWDKGRDNTHHSTLSSLRSSNAVFLIPAVSPSAETSPSTKAKWSKHTDNIT